MTELRLEFNGSNINDKLQSQFIFEQCISTPFEKALRLNQSVEVNLYQKVLESGVVVIGDSHVSVEKAECCNEKVGGYWHSLTIQHSRHQC